ncbi:MAG TPA: DUF998 domain-containing protein [Thermoanaerobaculia bacterium]|nr:DUF998 domain-containing protein [Thermoanaerobaculia bacterium]
MRKDEDLLISYLLLRQVIGWSGLLMPFVVRVGAMGFQHLATQGSVSAYYYTDMRDVFVSTLVLVGTLIACYRTPNPGDNVVSIVAGLAAIGIGLFPTDPKLADTLAAACPCLTDRTCLLHGILGYHMDFVIVFFALCFVMVTFQFPRGTPRHAAREMRMRNVVYRVCGVLMLLAFIAIGVVQLRGANQSFFWPESIAVFAFGVAWLVKGQTILKDKPGDPRRFAE